MSMQVLYPFFLISWFLFLLLSYVGFRYQSLFKYMVCKYILSFYRLYFHFIDCFLCYAEVFCLFDVVWLVYFFFFLPMLLIWYPKNNCQDQCHGAFPLFSSRCLTFKSLIDVELGFLYGVKYRFNFIVLHLGI